MHLRTLSLRNYRVYRSVDLEFPDGLIGSRPKWFRQVDADRVAALCLYGDSRTDKWELRSAGVGDDVRVELVFEHEGNTYDVRRRLKGRNLTPEVEVFLNGSWRPSRCGRPTPTWPGWWGWTSGRSWPRCAPSRRS
jgi:hypothetical protein